MRIAVTTPTGNIGSRVVERLLESDAEVVVLARDPGRLPEAVRARAAVRQGALEDADFVREATVGADALFLLVPPHPTTEDWEGFQLGVGRIAADAVRVNGIGRVVVLSSVGAHRDDLLAITRLGKVERMMEEAAPNVVSLRAGFFFENFLGAVPTIADHGSVYMSSGADTRIPMVATRDIGDAAARWLLDGGGTGHHVRGVQGAADLTFAEAAAAIGAGVGREVRYVQVPAAAAKEALMGMGSSEHVADEYARMFTALAAAAGDHEPRTAETTTPTTLEAWAREVMRPLVEAAAAGGPGATSGVAALV
jgi:uncharacterized protein YbjT (DUF2867 family)